MKRKFLIAFLAVVFLIGVAIGIAAHCGSTWVAQSPTFGPTLGPNGCIADSNPTTTSKSVQTTIPQPEPASGEPKNGFLALAEYDKVSNGGNGDGFITAADSIFTSLRLWRDVNHNGYSETGELFQLQSLHVVTLDLTYKASKHTDQYGNQFRYRAKVKDSQNAQVSHWMWDVFLLRL